MSLGEATAEAMRDRAFEARVQHYLRDHGVDHPRRLVDVQTLDPLERARLVVDEERIQGRTPAEWIALSKAESLLALRPAPLPEADLASAVARLAAATGSPYTPVQLETVRRDAAALDPELRAPLARLATRVADAYEAQLPLAADAVARARVADEPLDLVLTDQERNAMLANAEALVAAANALRADLDGVEIAASAAPLFRDPFGLVVVRGTGPDAHPRDGIFQDPILSVDLGGDDAYAHAAGAACPEPFSIPHRCNRLALALAVDLGGADNYSLSGTEPHVAQGAGSFGGVGVLVDFAGADAYTSHNRRSFQRPVFDYVDGGAQGMGQAGVGILLDAAGNDVYRADVSTAGLSVWDFGQGYGGLGGVGILADASGDDTYLAHGLASTMFRGHFQGVYTNGASIWGGVGLTVDTGAGDDLYAALDQATSTDYYAQGFGAFGGLGILYEDGGNDDYSAVEEIVNNPTGTGIIVPLLNCAFGTGSFAGVGIFLEMGGHDTYFGDSISPRAAYTMNEGFGGPGMAYGVFVDVSGDDGHFMEANGGAGSATFGRGVLIVGGNIFLGAGGNMFGTYLDAGGTDVYTGAAPSRDNAHWIGGADLNLLPNVFG